MSEPSELGFRIFHEGECIEFGAFRFPVTFFEFGKEGVSGIFSGNEREPYFVGASGFEERGINLGTADDERDFLSVRFQ